MAHRRALLKPRRVNVESTTIFVVACEGENTERIYFEWIQNLVEAGNADFHFRIKPLGATAKGDSKPEDVIERMNRFLDSNGVTRKDHAWLVMDVDHHTYGVNLQKLQNVVQEASRKKYRVALSNACFEVWLMLHFTATVPSVPSTQMERETKKVWPDYEKSNYPAAHLENRIVQAMQRAKTRDATPDESLPMQAGTRIYQLMENLREAIQRAGGTPPF